MSHAERGSRTEAPQFTSAGSDASSAKVARRSTTEPDGTPAPRPRSLTTRAIDWPVAGGSSRTRTIPPSSAVALEERAVAATERPAGPHGHRRHRGVAEALEGRSAQGSQVAAGCPQPDDRDRPGALGPAAREGCRHRHDVGWPLVEAAEARGQADDLTRERRGELAEARDELAALCSQPGHLAGPGGSPSSAWASSTRKSVVASDSRASARPRRRQAPRRTSAASTARSARPSARETSPCRPLRCAAARRSVSRRWPPRPSSMICCAPAARRKASTRSSAQSAPWRSLTSVPRSFSRSARAIGRAGAAGTTARGDGSGASTSRRSSVAGRGGVERHGLVLAAVASGIRRGCSRRLFK